MLTPAGARALSQRGPASPPSLSRHRRPGGWGVGYLCEGEEKTRRGPGAEPRAGPSSQETRKIKGKKLKKPISRTPKGAGRGRAGGEEQNEGRYPGGGH